MGPETAAEVGLFTVAVAVAVAVVDDSRHGPSLSMTGVFPLEYS